MALPNINDLIGAGVTEAGFKTALQQFLENVASLDLLNNNGLFNPVIVPNTSITLAEDFRTRGWYIFTSATAAIAAGFPEPAAGFLFVMSSGNMVHQKWMPFNSNSEYTRTSNVSAVFPAFQKLITQAALDSRLANELSQYLSIENVEQYTTKPYDIITMSKNLYDESKKQTGILVGNNGALQAAAGWSCTDFIPVVAGQYYTISFEAKRQNLAFYDQKGSVGLLAIEYNTSTANPLTVQAPVGAQYLVVNLDSTTVTASKVQVELGQSATPYEPGGKQYKIDASYLSEATTSEHSLSIDGNNATLNGIVDGLPITMNMWLTKVGTTGELTVFNFASDYVNGVLQRNLGDDVAPMRLDGTTVGANHGYRKTNLTAAGHGKSAADIGSVWTNGTKEFVIVEIVSSSILAVTSRTDNTDATATTFTHVSGASNTASFTATSATTGLQWYPSIRDRKLNCFVDDSQIDLSVNSVYSFKRTVSFLESYSIMKKSDIVAWLIENVGQDYANYDAVPAYTVSFSYTFDQECSCAIYFSGVGRKTVDLADQMITQSVQLAQGNGTVYNYIPKAVEFTDGGFTYNFSQLEDIRSKNPSRPLYLTSSRQEISVNPVDRIVMLNDQVGYATGYLPILDAESAVRATNASNKYLEIRNGSLKLYPRLIDSASITSINENDTFACIAYRKYFKRSADRTCKYVVRSKLGDYLYLDWHTAKTDEIELPADLVGRNFTVHEKSSNVTVLSQFTSNNLLVKIDNTKSYGYLVLKFE
ncbi:pyocin knob domain-containing protein [Acinetobacter baumannii]|uniref:pyocin knob domain-containing protein n=1 Tax=Acinetobacter baumannii TaxID=470 RepID=UPI002449D60B|nr:pyocin knob domain-containing protein [Acinetobacter baumannii]MDH2626647.1 pyocin knob domain-containing protein [Acinetobacter baumannii]